MKRILIFAVVGLVMFGAGFGGGLILGRTMAPQDDNAVGTGKVIQNPGPIVSIGEFTSNLAGAGRHVSPFRSNSSKKKGQQLSFRHPAGS